MAGRRSDAVAMVHILLWLLVIFLIIAVVAALLRIWR